jgi:hypothetical protein
MQFNTLHIYYLSTPVFFLLHFGFDVNLRISIPGAADAWLYAYYALCFLASLVAFRNAVTGALFSLLESSVNILLLLLSVLMPIYTVGHTSESFVTAAFGVPELLHFLIAGSILLISFYRNPLVSPR